MKGPRRRGRTAVCTPILFSGNGLAERIRTRSKELGTPLESVRAPEGRQRHMYAMIPAAGGDPWTWNWSGPDATFKGGVPDWSAPATSWPYEPMKIVEPYN